MLCCCMIRKPLYVNRNEKSSIKVGKLKMFHSGYELMTRPAPSELLQTLFLLLLVVVVEAVAVVFCCNIFVFVCRRQKAIGFEQRKTNSRSSGLDR